ncbi:spore coat protein [Sporosarcina sp. NCCP-2716]|uniref:spore coat protein n=1 Tax=Sporosarcina sp. NCCP-2716 TaxID=2943679 RepID=UPI0020420B66|nr:spore coat protein [Sporosarcina sp. NCCP-2716]
MYNSSEEEWCALDPSANHPCNPCGSSDNGDITNTANVLSDIDQSSHELIVIRDSCDVTVSTSDTQIAVSLQAALQVAIAVVVNITIADSARAEKVTQELLERAQIRQANYQRLIIVNSRGVDVTTTDTDVAISLQLLLQILVALVAQLDIL